MSFNLKARLTTLALIVGTLGVAAQASAQQVTLQFANWASAEPTTQAGIEKVIKMFEAENVRGA